MTNKPYSFTSHEVEETTADASGSGKRLNISVVTELITFLVSWSHPAAVRGDHHADANELEVIAVPVVNKLLGMVLQVQVVLIASVVALFEPESCQWY